jgi:ribosomal protein L16 Arg81 hydroxylase
MKPGDVLYLPRGQYHEALASSDASLHLSFGIGQPTGIDVISRLLKSLPDESFAWALERDYVDESEFLKRFGALGPEDLQDLLGRLEASSVLERI